MLTLPWMRFISWNSCCSLTEFAVGFTCCASEGAGAAMLTSSSSAQAPTASRINLAKDAMRSSQYCGALTRRSAVSGADRLAIGGPPAPRAGPVAALADPLLVDLSDD